MTRALVLFSIIPWIAGCSDECLTAESRCSGDHQVESCIQSDGFLGDHWGEIDDCAQDKICVEITDPEDGRLAATCTSSSEPDPRCPQGVSYAMKCGDARTLLRCWHGYGDELPCPDRCLIDADGRARCVQITGG